MRVFGALAFAALLLCGASAPSAPPVKLASSADISIHDYGDHDTDCAEWTDRCRTCSRGAGGDQFCSNIGPACQPTAITCSRKITPAQ
jgi:hypothetical protein